MSGIGRNILTLMTYLIFLLTSNINVEHHDSMDLNISYKGYNVTNIKYIVTNIPVAVGYNDYY